MSRKPIVYLALIVFAALFYYEVLAPDPSTAVPNNPANANALGVPTAPVNASTITPAQLGTGLFENASGLGQQQPESTYGS
jgi:hypothetical protein